MTRTPRPSLSLISRSAKNLRNLPKPRKINAVQKIVVCTAMPKDIGKTSVLRNPAIRIDSVQIPPRTALVHLAHAHYNLMKTNQNHRTKTSNAPSVPRLYHEPDTLLIIPESDLPCKIP
jgi:hypothetical protein